MHELVGLEEFLATNFSDSERTTPTIVDDDATWRALIPKTGSDASEDGEMLEDANMQYRSLSSRAASQSQTQTQTQILALWRPEFETPHQDRTLPLLPTSPHSMNLFDDWEEGGLERMAPIVEKGDLLEGRGGNYDYDYDYLDDDELACLPSQLRLSQGQLLLSQPASSPTARRTGMVLTPANNATASLVTTGGMEGGGFTTAAGRQLAPPSEQSWAKARAILDMVAVSEQGPDLTETSRRTGDPGSPGKHGVPVAASGGGFSTAGGKRIASPSKEAKARAQALLTGIDRDLGLAQKSPEGHESHEHDVGERVREQESMMLARSTEVSTCFPAFATASGRKIASPSKEAKRRVQHLLSLDDQPDVQVKDAFPPQPQSQVPSPQMSLFSTASGRKVKTPKKESIAFATRLMSAVEVEKPLTRRPISLVPPTPPTPKIQFALKRNGPKPLMRRALAISKPVRPVMPPPLYSPSPNEPRQPMRTFLQPQNDTSARVAPLPLDFSVSEVVSQSRSLWPLASNQWLQNHAVAVLWKMLAYQRASQESPGSGLSFTRPSYFIAQINHRYAREFIHAHRSILKRICERDDSPGGHMILFIQSVEHAGGEEDKFDLTLSDGWYSLPAIIDEKINRLTGERRLRVGSKLKICMAQVISNDACDILEASTYGVKIKIHGNSIAPARWDARLGKQKSKLFTVALSSLSSDGGSVCCVDIVILRRYPINYMVEYESGRRRSLNRADLDQLERTAFHTDVPGDSEGAILPGDQSGEPEIDRIVSVKAPARFLVQDNCPCPRVAQAFLTLWEASEEMLQRMQAGAVVKITGLRTLSQRRRGLLQLASTRNGTRVIFTKAPPRNPESLTRGFLQIMRSTDLRVGVEGDLYAQVLTNGPDHCWLLISNFEDDSDGGGLAFIRTADGVKTPFVSIPPGRLASFLDIAFLYRDPRYGFPVFLFGELSQVTMMMGSDPAHPSHNGLASRECGEPRRQDDEQSDKVRNALQRVREITNQS